MQQVKLNFAGLNHFCHIKRLSNANDIRTRNRYRKPVPENWITVTSFLQVCHTNRYRFFSGTEIWYGVEQCSTRCRKPWPKWRVLIGQAITSCVVCLYKLCCLLFYCFKMNWGTVVYKKKLIQKFCFQFHMVRKICVRKMVPVFWYRFSVPVSGACVIGIRRRQNLKQ